MKLISKHLPPGSHIYLLTLSLVRNGKRQQLNAVRQALKEQGITLVNFNYRPFGFRMALKMAYILFYLIFFIWLRRIKLVHAWCTPGGSIGYMLSAITGVPLVLDSFEPHAETMVETGTWSKRGLAYRALFLFEKLQLRRASHVICAAHGMIAYSQKVYGITKDHYFVKPACVDLQLFQREKGKMQPIAELPQDAIVCVYAGKFGDIYLSGEVFDFFRVASQHWGKRFRVLLLSNHSDEEIDVYCRNAGLDRAVVIKRFVPHDNVPAYMALAHFGICPVNPVPTKEFCTPIKNGEYWAMGLPVVITKNISTDSALIASQNAGYVLQQLNEQEYRNAVTTIDALLADPTLNQRIRAMAETQRNFAIAEKIYAAVYS